MKISEKAIMIMPYYYNLIETTETKNKEISELKMQVDDFWEFLIEKDLVEEFYQWEQKSNEKET